MIKLVIRPEPYADESFMGYFLRLAEENCFETPFILIKLGKLDSKSKNASVNEYIKPLASGEIDLSKISDLSQETIDTLESLRYPIVLSSIEHYPDIHEFFFYDVPSNFLRFAYPRVCVECLKEKSYHRSSWDFAPLTCCPKHSTLLVDICPSCNKQLTWSRRGINYCQCGQDLTEIQTIKLDHNHTWLSNEIQLLLNYTSSNVSINSSYETSTRRFDDLIDILQLLDDQSKKLADSRRKKFRYEFQWQPNPALHKTVMLLVSELNVGPKFTKPFTPEKNTTLAVRAQGLKNIHSNKILKKQIKGNEQKSFDRLIELISKPQLCSSLGISPTLLKSLEKNGVINPVAGPKLNGAGDYQYSIKEIDDVLKKLNSLSSTQLNNSISIRRYIKTFGVKAKRPLGMIIESILKGYVQFNISSAENSLLDIELEQASLESFIQRTQEPSSNDEFISVKEAAEQLTIYVDAIYRSLKAGIIPHSSKGRTKLISRDDLQNFIDRYVFVSELAKEYGCNPTNLSDKIIDEGIKPVSGPGIDGNLINIFAKNDINTLDMQSVINKRDYDTNTGRKSKKIRKQSYLELVETLSLVTTTEAANILRISIQQLSKLIRNDYLTVETNSLIPSYKKYIRLSEIEAYENRYKNNPGLVSKTDAIEALGETESRFFNNWVRFKRLELINDGLDNEYVDKKFLEQIKEFKHIALSAADAADHLGLGRHEIANLKKLGKLHPISGPGVDNYGNYFYRKEDIESLSHGNWW